ncbi:MAG: ABC transporter ATP-binding protein/permease [Lachnospiraceae bacterium]|nr:ABC transporter ATP-binding protein/permease [Lachnospiraceae bacterium]
MKHTNSLFRQLSGQLFSHNKIRFFLACVAALYSGFGGIIVSWLLKQLIDTASGAEGALSFKTILLLTGADLLLFILFFLLDLYTRPEFIRRAVIAYKNMAYEKLTQKGITSFRDESTAAYVSALSNDVTSIEANYLSQLFSLVSKLVMFFGSVIMMVLYSPILTLISVLVTILPLAASLLTGDRLVKAEKTVSDQNSSFMAMLSDTLAGYSVIKSFKAEKEIYGIFAKENRRLEDARFSREKLKTTVGMIGALAGMLAQMGVFISGAYLILTGHDITIGTVLMFVNLMNFMIQPVAALPGILAGRKAGRELIRKLAESLECNTGSLGDVDISGLKCGISLKNVSFAYEEGKEILHDINAEFDAGKSYAIVGGSGSGKSTLLNLLMNPGADYRGQICMDGRELRTIDPDAIFGIISLIQQNVFVFNASIRDNVTMFRDFSQEELDRAVRQAHLDDLINERGGDTLCGENGCALSGGEKQRISIARSLLKNSSVLLADEATSALDPQTAWQVSEDILDQSGMTRIVVTHSLEEELLKRYDGIMVLKDGKIEETGTFNELMERKGYFYALFTVSQ